MKDTASHKSAGTKKSLGYVKEDNSCPVQKKAIADKIMQDKEEFTAEEVAFQEEMMAKLANGPVEPAPSGVVMDAPYPTGPAAEAPIPPAPVEYLEDDLEVNSPDVEAPG